MRHPIDKAAGNVREFVRRGVKAASGGVSEAYNSALDWKDNGQVSRWLTRHFSQQQPTPGSRAMDHEYLQTHVGGGWHRLYDGGHTIAGSWKAVGEALPHPSFLEHIGVWADEYWKDFVTTRGMPVFLLDHAHHVSEYLKHLDCIDAAQLIGAPLVGVSIYRNWNDPEKLTASAAASDLSGAWYANFVAPVCSIFGLVRAYWLVRRSEQKALQKMIAPALQGLTRSGATLLFVTVVPGGFLLHLSGGIVISLAHKHACDGLSANKHAIFAALKECVAGFTERRAATP